jgi:DNA polymerase-3 subunit alpha
MDQPMGSDYFDIHAHSEWSTLDAMGTVEDLVAMAAKQGKPALALTDHGTMAGALRLYKHCKKHDLAAFPGSELYVVRDIDDKATRDIRYHLGMVALDFTGYKAMVKLSSASHRRDRFHRKPLVDLNDLAEFSDAGMAQHVAVTTGCYFGLVVQQMATYKSASKGEAMVKMLANWFPNLYVELQNHGVDHGDGTDDFQIAEMLWEIAQNLGLPVVVGQDAHYCEVHSQPVHDLMKDICYFGDGEDDRFPGGPYHLAGVEELKPFFADKWDAIEEGHGDLLDKHRLSIPALDTYRFHVPEVSKAPMTELMKGVEAGAVLRGIPRTAEYKERAKYERDVIDKMGMANYFLLFAEFTDWCRENGVIINARGSVNGSLITYLLGISEVDPILWDTDFDRFISLDRQKPPDIDMDVESGKRGLLLDHAKKKFPSMVQIGTYTRLGITEQDDGDGITEDKGSVFVQYMAAMRKKGNFDGKVKPEHRDALNKLADMKVRRALGVHAAGIVLPTEDHRVEDYLATGLVASSNTTVTQAVMEDVEDAGFVKGDFLGVKMLETLSITQRNLGKDPNDWSWIPWDDELACRTLRSGYTTGIFQFNGFSTMMGGKEMGVRSTQDAILCLALYRPALMDNGQKDLYLHNRKYKSRSRQHRLHQFFDPILDVSLGVPIFQEQIMQMCKAIGMAYDDWNDLMKAVKASNDKIGQYAAATMARIKPNFMALCAGKGIPQEDADEAWGAVVGFTDYGFNKAHATSYGIMAYRSAYLKAHHPLEYMHALLTTWAGTKKEPKMVSEARRLGIAIVRADVNKSDFNWTIDRSRSKPTIRRGLLSIDGIGDTVAASIIDCRPVGGWTSMDDFIDTTPSRPVTGGKDWTKHGTLNGIMAKLRDAGALTSLGVT